MFYRYRKLQNDIGELNRRISRIEHKADYGTSEHDWELHKSPYEEPYIRCKLCHARKP